MKYKIAWYSTEKRMGLVMDDSGNLYLVHETAFKNKNANKTCVSSLVKLEKSDLTLIKKAA